MKKLMFVVLSIFLSACSTVGQNTSLEGIWVWEDIDQVGTSPVFKKHILILGKESYEELFFENTKAKGTSEGVLFSSQMGENIEFSTTGNVQTIYKGKMLKNQLMIISMNNKLLSPSALYTRQ